MFDQTMQQDGGRCIGPYYQKQEIRGVTPAISRENLLLYLGAYRLA